MLDVEAGLEPRVDPVLTRLLGDLYRPFFADIFLSATEIGDGIVIDNNQSSLRQGEKIKNPVESMES